MLHASNPNNGTIGYPNKKIVTTASIRTSFFTTKNSHMQIQVLGAPLTLFFTQSPVSYFPAVKKLTGQFRTDLSMAFNLTA